MATFTITIDDAKAARIIAAARGFYPNATVAMTNLEVAQWVIKNGFRDLVARWESQQANDAAYTQAQSDFSNV
jgi:hypothetical protein